MEEPPMVEEDCLLVQPLIVAREDLASEAKQFYAGVLSALKRGWNTANKRKFNEYYIKRDELSITPDGVLCWNDRIIIPRCCGSQFQMTFIHHTWASKK